MKKCILVILVVALVLLNSGLKNPIVFAASLDNAPSSAVQSSNPPSTDENLSGNLEDHLVGTWYSDPGLSDGGILQAFGDDNRYIIVTLCDRDNYSLDYWKNNTFRIVFFDYIGARGTWEYVDGKMTVTLTFAVPFSSMMTSIDVEKSLSPPLVFTYEISDFHAVEYEYLDHLDYTAIMGSAQFWRFSDKPVWENYDDLLSVEW